MNRVKSVTFLTALFLVSCAPKETPGPTTAPPSVTETPTETAAPPTTTATPETETPTNTPVVEIIERTPEEVDELEAGTYLVYSKTGYPTNELILIKSDGSIKTTRTFHVENPYFSIDGVSPTGGLFAHVAGTAGDYPNVPVAQSYDLHIEIRSLTDGRVLEEIPLLSEEYPANFLELVQAYTAPLDPMFENESDESVASALMSAFLWGIGSSSWSPDGRYLAFAGQMEGLSSDVYLFDSNTYAVQRLTSGPGQILSIGWSPNGRQIWHSSAYWVGVHTPLSNHVVSLDGAHIISFPYEQGEFFDEWLNNEQFLASEGGIGIGGHEVQLFDIREGTVRMIWPYQFHKLAINSRHNLLLVVMPEESLSDVSPGVFIIDPITSANVRIADGSWWSGEAVDDEEYIFVVSKHDEGTYLLSKRYTWEKISEKDGFVEVSPNDELIAVFGGINDPGLEIYSLEDRSTCAVYDRYVSSLIWAPDSSSIFFESDDFLYLYDSFANHVVQVDRLEKYISLWPGDSKFIEIPAGDD